MRFHTNRLSLLDAVNSARAVIPSRPSKPVLNNVRLSAGTVGGVPLAISATDLEWWATHAVRSVQVDLAGDALVSADRFAAALNAATDDSVTVEASEGKVLVTSKAGRVSLYAGVIGDYPPSPDAGKVDSSATVDAALLVAALRKVSPCASPGAKNAFGGIFLETDRSELCVVAADGKRLAKVTVPILEGAASISAVVPLAIRKLLSAAGVDGNVTLIQSGTRVRLQSDDWTCSCPTIEGLFPAYRDVIPHDFGCSVKCDRASLVAALRAVAVTGVEGEAKDGMPAETPFNLDAGAGGFLLAAASHYGASEIKYPCRWDGKPMLAQYAVRFWSEPLEAAEHEIAELCFTNEKRPMLMKLGPDFEVVIMPRNRT